MAVKLIREVLSEKGFSKVEPIGEGGYAVVVKAFHPRYGVVAVKIPKALLAGVTIDPDKLLREVEVWRRVSHPYIVRLVDVVELAGRIPALIMEYCPTSLREMLKRSGKLNRDLAIDVAVKVAKALAYLHSQGIVHGDVKPENVLFTADGEPKLSDLGSARVVLEVARSTGYTPLYAAPEQLARGEVLDKTDVYQLALLVHEMLTGEPCNPALYRPCREDALPEPLRAALAMEPAERPDTATVLKALEALREAPMVAPRVVKPAAPIVDVEALKLMPQTVMLERLGKDRVHLCWSPDGRSVAAVSKGAVAVWRIPGFEQALAREVDVSKVQDSGHACAWSPTAKLIAIAEHDLPYRVQLFEIGTGRLVVLGRHDGPVRSVSWSPDGRLLASVGDDKKLVLWSPEGVVKLRSSFKGWIYDVAFHPDGDRIALAGEALVEGKRKVVVVDARGRLLAGRKVDAWSVRSCAWSRDGRVLAYCDVLGWLGIYTPETGKFTEERDLFKAGFFSELYSTSLYDLGGERYLVAAGGSKGMLLLAVYDYKARRLEKVKQVKVTPKEVVSASFSPVQPLLALGDKKGNAVVVNLYKDPDVRKLLTGE